MGKVLGMGGRHTGEGEGQSDCAHWGLQAPRLLLVARLLMHQNSGPGVPWGSFNSHDFSYSSLSH